MQLTPAQLAQKRERNRKSQRASRQRVKDQIDTLKRQNKDLELNNVSLQERLRHALAAIEVLEKARCPTEAKAAALPHTNSHTPSTSSNASTSHHHSSIFTQCPISKPVQLSSASHSNYNLSSRYTLPHLTYPRGSHGRDDGLDVGSPCESKVQSENGWEYSSLHLSPDVTETASTLFEDLET